MSHQHLRQHKNAQRTKRACSRIPKLSAASASSRFQHFIQHIDRIAVSLDPAQRYILCAVAFEAILSLNQLREFLKASDKPIRVGEHVYVEWTEDNAKHRRALSARTTIALSLLTQNINWAMELIKLPRLLVDVYPQAERFHSRSLVQTLFEDAHAWAHLTLGQELLSVVLGKTPIALLETERLKAMSQLAARPEAANERSELPLESEIDNAAEVAMTIAGEDESNGYRARCLREMSALFSTESQSDSPRLSDWKVRKLVCQRIDNTATHILRHGAAADGLLLDWICFMLQEGSVRLKNPVISTVQRYFYSVAHLVSEFLQSIQAVPSELGEGQWRELLETLFKNGTVQQSAALSFQQYCQHQYGIPPLLDSRHGLACHDVVRAGIVWPHEYERLVARAMSASINPRINDSIQIILILANTFAIRAGEVQALTIGDVQIGTNELIVHFHPRRGRHSGKTYAAIRAMTSQDPLARRLLERWLDRRKREGAVSSDLLFGDPHDPEKLYRFAFCMRWINHQLKQITGDPQSSFHDLRHTVVDRILFAILDQQTQKSATLGAAPVRAQVGHAANSDTMLTSYFHRPELAVRIVADSTDCASELSSKAAGFWLSDTADTVRKAKQRSGEDANYYLNQVRQAALKLFKEEETAAQPEQQNDDQASETYETVRRFMADVLAAKNTESIMWRCSLTVPRLWALTSAVYEAYSVVSDRRVELPPTPPNSQSELDSLLEKLRLLIESLGFDFEFKDAKSMQCLIDHLESTQGIDPIVRAITLAWVKCRHGQYLSLHELDAAWPLLKWLKRKKFNPACLQLRYVKDAQATSSPADSQTQDLNDQQSVISSVQNKLNLSCRPMEVKPKRGRPDVYLLICCTPPEATAVTKRRSAAVRMGRFNSLMFNALVWSSLCKLQGHAA
jgi:integrase